MNNNLTLKRLYEILKYDSEKGIFTWIKNNKQAGSVDNKGYERISIDKVRYKSHRLAWLYYHGVFPSKQIDHIDGNKLNNAISNLRDVSQKINMYNKQVAHKSNINNTLGVSSSGSKFTARLRVEGKLLHLGTYNTKEEAQMVYMQKKLEIIHALTIQTMD